MQTFAMTREATDKRVCQKGVNGNYPESDDQSVNSFQLHSDTAPWGEGLQT